MSAFKVDRSVDQKTAADGNGSGPPARAVEQRSLGRRLTATSARFRRTAPSENSPRRAGLCQCQLYLETRRRQRQLRGARPTGNGRDRQFAARSPSGHRLVAHFRWRAAYWLGRGLTLPATCCRWRQSAIWRPTCTSHAAIWQLLPQWRVTDRAACTPLGALQGRRRAGRWRGSAQYETVQHHSLVVSSACKPSVGSPPGPGWRPDPIAAQGLGSARRSVPRPH